MIFDDETLNKIVRQHLNWRTMIDRCHNPRNRSFKNYGGRGVVVCVRWRESFAAFLADMGFRPSEKHSLDRRENDKGYNKENCRWATAQEQNDNRRDTILVAGKPLSFWVKETGLKKHTLDMRLRAGWSIERVLTPTLQKRGPVSRLSNEEKKERVRSRQQSERGHEISRTASARWRNKQRTQSQIQQAIGG